MDKAEILEILNAALICAHKAKNHLNIKSISNPNDLISEFAEAYLMNESTLLWLEDLKEKLKCD